MMMDKPEDKERVCDFCWAARKSRVVWRHALDTRRTRIDVGFHDVVASGEPLRETTFIANVTFETVFQGAASIGGTVGGGGVIVEIPRAARPGARYAVATLVFRGPDTSDAPQSPKMVHSTSATTTLAQLDETAAFGACRIPLIGNTDSLQVDVLTPGGDRTGLSLHCAVRHLHDDSFQEDVASSLPGLYRDGDAVSGPWPPLLRDLLDDTPVLDCGDVVLPRNERVLEIFDDVQRGTDSGTLFVTTHRLVFVSDKTTSIPHGGVLETSIKASNDDGLALRLSLYDFAVETFVSSTVAYRDWLWTKREIAWRQREDRFHCIQNNDIFGTTPESRPRRQKPPPPPDDDDDELTTTTPKSRAEKRRALQKFLAKSPPKEDGWTHLLEDDSDDSDEAASDKVVEDFERMGVLGDHRWRMSLANSGYGLCGTYPRFLVVPSAVSDGDLYAGAKWRSKGRIPVLVYYHKATGAPLCRASQPMVGLSGPCPEDEKLLLHLRAATARTSASRRRPSFEENGDHPQPPILRICDARPLLNAKANAAMGKGHEDIARLGGKESASLEFLNVANIHVMHDSFKTLREALLAGAGAETLPSQLGVDDDYDDDDPRLPESSSSSQEGNLFKALHDSRWLHHTAAILKGAVTVAAYLRRGDPVLVHCSDGWDRTSQVSAVAQFLLDPYYRTIRGFEALIEKEFRAYGYMFRERSGVPASLVHSFGGTERMSTTATTALASALHRFSSTTTSLRSTSPPPFPLPLPLVGSPPKAQVVETTMPKDLLLPPPREGLSMHETSPVFVQFLDAIFQITAQFPKAVEFDDRLLTFLWRHAYSRYFSDFLRDCDKHRVDDGVSLWRYVSMNRHRFTSVLYAPAENRTLTPSSSLRALQLCPMFLPTDAVPKTITTLRRRLEQLLKPSPRASVEDVAAEDDKVPRRQVDDDDDTRPVPSHDPTSDGGGLVVTEDTTIVTYS